MSTPAAPGPPTPIAVTGATGRIGGAVAALLHERGAPLRLLLRDPSRTPRWARDARPVAPADDQDGASAGGGRARGAPSVEVAVAQYGDGEAVRAALADGTIDVVGTDHAPHPLEDKDCEWQAGAFGMTGLETALSVLIATMVDTGRMTWRDIARVMSSAPARIGRLEDQGRGLEAGAPANVAVIDPAVRRTVDGAAQWTRSTNTPYAGMELPGRVMATFLHGRPTVLGGEPVARGEG